jgi:pseudouridylate synthase
MNIRINQEVEEAIQNNRPVVALESTIISHGMPYPQNVKTALLVEQEIRKYGAIPATIGIIDGVCVVGMSKEEIEEFGKRSNVVKVSRRDLPIIISQKLWGATTVASTMIIAALANIKVFVTGGIGGVHRGAETSFDISADLQELATTNVAVICAGPKAILDLPKTLEYLETYGVPVLGYQTEELPAFYSQTSGLKVDYRVDSPLEIAHIMKTKWQMKLKGGILVTNPIPKEYALDNKEMEKVIQEALNAAEKQMIKGKALTPFLLKYIKEATNGESLEANIALILNNARLGAQIAKEYNKIKGND